MTEAVPRLGASSNETFRALGDRNFVLYLFGLMVSLGGSYMQQVAEGWLIYRLSNSALTLGLVGFIAMIPLAPWVLVAGVLADRLPRRRLLILTQLGLVVPPLVLAGLIWANLVQVWHVVVVDVVMAALSALDQPARQAMVVDATSAENRDNAIALSGAGFSLARVIGPMIAGVLLAAFGEAVCFAINGISFLAVAVALAAMQLPRVQSINHRNSVGASLWDGVRYLARSPLMLIPLGLVVVMNLFIVPYQTLLPIFARDIFQSGAFGLGLLVTASGVGAILGSLAIANLKPGKRGPILLVLGLGAAVVTFVFTLFQSLMLASLALVVVSGAVIALKVLSYTMIQSGVPDDLRGRVMSFVVLFDAGAPRLGGLAAGFLAVQLAAPSALQVLAFGCLISVLALGMWSPSVRRLA